MVPVLPGWIMVDLGLKSPNFADSNGGGTDSIADGRIYCGWSQSISSKHLLKVARQLSIRR